MSQATKATVSPRTTLGFLTRSGAKIVYLETPELAENLNVIFCAIALRECFLKCALRIPRDSQGLQGYISVMANSKLDFLLNNRVTFLIGHVFISYDRFYFFLYRNCPQWARAFLLSRLHDHTQKHRTRQDSSGQVISPSQRPPLV